MHRPASILALSLVSTFFLTACEEEKVSNMRSSRLIIYLPFLGLLMASLAGCDEQASLTKDDGSKQPRPVKSVIVGKATASFKRSYPAFVLPAKQALLSFRASGKLIELPIRAAQKVRKGDVLAKLDPRDFEAEVNRLISQLDQAKAKLIEMQKGGRVEDVASLQANINAANSQFRAAQQQANRTKKLYDKGIVAKAKQEQDLSAVEVARAQLRVAQQELKKGKAGAREEQLAQQKAVIRGYETQLTSAEDTLRDATLRAPFNGIIAKREVDNFANVQANETIAILHQLETVHLVFDVPGPDVSLLADHAKSLVTEAQLDSMPGNSFEAKLVEFSTQADPATQTFRGRVSISPPKGGAVLPGMSGQIFIEDKSKEARSFLIPSIAVTAEPDGKPFVWVVGKPNNEVSKRYVITGEARGEDIIISKGLKPRDIVVTAGISLLRDKVTVRPVTKIRD